MALKSLLALFLMAVPAVALSAEDAAWSPQPVERLVKLPAAVLKKSIDRDFADSQLGAALRTAEDEIGYKGRTLADLKEATERADGAMEADLREQFLGEKRAFLDLAARKNALKRKELDTRRRLYERMLRDVDRTGGADTPQRRALVESQEAARTRFDSSLAAVDMRLFDSGGTAESRYGQKYGENRQAIERLLDRIKTHQMTAAARVEADDGRPLSRKDYLRQMLSETESETALLEQEETMLGYMARLVALDAMELAERNATTRGDLEADASPLRPADALGYFLSP
jgi:hypothetical protein